MKPKKFLATLKEYPWLWVSIRCLSGSIGKNGLAPDHDIQWAERNLRDINLVPFDETMLTEGNVYREQTIGTIPHGLAKKPSKKENLAKVTAFFSVYYRLACYRKGQDAIHVYVDDLKFIDRMEEGELLHCRPDNTLGRFVKGIKGIGEDCQIKFIVRTVTVGILGLTSTVSIDITPYPEVSYDI